MTPILPPSTVGVLGGGQLGRYALIAARTMGYRTAVLDPDPAAPAMAVADVSLVAEFDDESALTELADLADVVTVEFENPPAQSLQYLSRRTRVAPSPRAVAISQDRILEKRFLVDSGVPVAAFAVVESVEAEPEVSYPAILKTARFGYDGKGQRSVTSIHEMRAAFTLMGSVACVLEQRLPLDTELSVVVARTALGHVAAFPVAENTHVDGILDLTVVPAVVAPTITDRAIGLAMTVADSLDYVGVMAVEMFVVDGKVLVNEIAPRPHNSGHWTLDAAHTSQFAQQVRAVCGLPLGDTSMTRPGAAMVNLLGDLWDPDMPDWAAALERPNLALHLYGKVAARPGRKMGHLTAWASTGHEAATAAIEARTRASRRA